MDLKSGYPFSLIRYGLPCQYPKLDKTVKADVVVIGGGISGALTAYHLVEAGIGCIVVDGRSIGLGSTCASTSLLQYEIDVPLTELSQKIGHENASRAYNLCRRSVRKLEAIAAKIGLTEFKPNKSLYFAAYKKDKLFLEKEFRARKSIGMGVELLDENEIKKKFGFYAPAAILSDDGAYADAYLFTHALHQFSMKKGLRVFDRTFIKKVSESKQGLVLTTEDNIDIKAKKIVYATGYEVYEFFNKKIVSLHSTYATTSESFTEEPKVLTSETMFWNTADPYLYFRGTSDARVIIGGRDEKFFSPGRRDKLIEKKSKQLAGDFSNLFPDVQFKREFSWTGTFGSTIDGLPFIGRYAKYPNRYFALGFGGNGITFSLMAAEIIRDLLTGKSNKDAGLFSFARV